ncbi:flagellar basal body rod protein FlgC [bacterium]|nr:flagellar basal body rod protein FlgC [bacterium]
MSLNTFDIAASGMTAQRIKMDTVASNIANVNTTRNPDGSKGVYVKKRVNFKAIYEDELSRGARNFAANSTDARFNPVSGRFEINTGIALNQGLVSNGVRVESIQETDEPTKLIYDPNHPDADAEGYVELPNINVVEEMVDMVSASKAYEANSVVAENVKTMIQSALNI